MTVLLFGVTRDIVGSPTLSITAPSAEGFQIPKTVGELRKYLGGNFPELNNLTSLAIAVNNNYADDNKAINSSDEVALIPPVSGG